MSKVVVNGKPYNLIDKGNFVQYYNLPCLAFGNSKAKEYIEKGMLFTITYKNAEVIPERMSKYKFNQKADGVMILGDLVNIKDGTIFNVLITDNS